jgi:hypothetical protein
MNPETFLQYITRKTGVGRTSRIMAGLIHAGCALFIGVSAHNYPDPWWWAAGAIALMVLVGFWWNTFDNYMADQKRLSKPPNQNHYDDVCEGCDPVMFKNRKPITDIVKWYAASRKMSREMAAHILGRTGGVGIVDEHAAYLAKFPKP